jgi:hypothetical protein
MVVKPTEMIRFMVAFAIPYMLLGKNPIWLSAIYFHWPFVGRTYTSTAYFNLAFARVLLLYISTTKTKCKHMKYQREKRTKKTRMIRRAVAATRTGRRLF